MLNVNFVSVATYNFVISIQTQNTYQEIAKWKENDERDDKVFTSLQLDNQKHGKSDQPKTPDHMNDRKHIDQFII